jgi:hypothetical protein
MMKFTVSDQAEAEIRRLRHENAGKRRRIRELETELEGVKAELAALRRGEVRPEGMLTLEQSLDALKGGAE